MRSGAAARTAGQDVFVGNLEWGITEDELRQAFEDAGFEVTKSRIMIDSETKRSKGYGFVTIVDGDLEAVIERMNGFELAGRKLGVERPRKNAKG